MSQAASRASRREIRRALGPTALQSLENVARAGEGLAQIVAGLDTTVDRHTDELASLRKQQGATFNSLAEFCGRSFCGRLRWLVTGR